jgi:prephenate dehydrogenase
LLRFKTTFQSMKILILGAGKMGTFLTDVLCFQHEVALFDTDPKRLRFVFNTLRMTQYEEIKAFQPELVINCVTLKYTIDAFRKVLPFLPDNCILSDIASVKTGLKSYYESSGMRYVSTHPMFGPTFATLDNLSSQSAIIIAESDHMGKAFFKDLYGSLRLKIFEYTFEEHDQTIAYSLSIPFASTLVFASVMKPQEAPGTTFKRHMDIAKGLLSEDDYLLTEILFNPYTPEQLNNIRGELRALLDIIDQKDSEAMHQFLKKVRKNIE